MGPLVVQGQSPGSLANPLGQSPGPLLASALPWVKGFRLGRCVGSERYGSCHTVHDVA